MFYTLIIVVSLIAVISWIMVFFEARKPLDETNKRKILILSSLGFIITIGLGVSNIIAILL